VRQPDAGKGCSGTGCRLGDEGAPSGHGVSPLSV
jgi:hypothetical protein